MSANLLYSQKGSDAATITWPGAGPPNEQWKLTSGVPLNIIQGLIGYPNGLVVYADGRATPQITAQASTVVHKPS